MQYLTHIPPAPLCWFVEWFFFYEGYAPPHTREKRLPDGVVELIINLTENPKWLFDSENNKPATPFQRCWISGQQKNFLLIDVAGETSMMGIRFKAGGAHPFFKFPMSELRDQVVELDQVWGRQAHFIQEKLVEAASPELKFQLLENFLIEQASRELAPNPFIEFAVKALYSSTEDLSIKMLTEKTGISHKHLIRTFDKVMGIKPKLLARIFKFQKAIHLLELGKPVKWTDLAYECGYFDQAHFIKEFQHFSGINPTAYFDNRGEYMNYLPA